MPAVTPAKVPVGGVLWPLVLDPKQASVPFAPHAAGVQVARGDLGELPGFG